MSETPEPAADTPEPVEVVAETDQDVIEQGEWADCWICEDVFRRRTQTKRFCTECRRGFCEGWHGSLARGYGTCVVCWEKTEISPELPPGAE